MKTYALTVILLFCAGVSADVLATVNDEVLTWDDLLEQAGGIEALRYMGITTESAASQILDAWVKERLVVSGARSTGILNRPEVQKAVQEAIDRILIEAFLEDLLEGIEVSRLEVENYLDIWRDSYSLEYKVRHILLDSGVLAASVRSRFAAGESFESLAVAFSSCPSSREGGNLGWIRRGMTGSGFMETVCSLEPGQLSDVVETTAGYHLIQVLDVRNLAAPPTASQLFQIAGEEILGSRREKAVVELLASLRAQHTVVTYPQRLLNRL
jgi:hypothetical protein